MLDHCSPIIGIREGKRAVGEYILTVEGLRQGQCFDDAVDEAYFILMDMTRIMIKEPIYCPKTN
jgi:hypothetical protein